MSQARCCNRGASPESLGLLLGVMSDTSPPRTHLHWRKACHSLCGCPATYLWRLDGLIKARLAVETNKPGNHGGLAQ